MSCIFCHGAHRDPSHACIAVLRERIEKLESAQDAPETMLEVWRAKMAEPLSLNDLMPSPWQRKDSPRGGTDQPSPPDAGVRTTVQGGGAGGVPAGYKLAPGWHERHPEDYSECTWGLTRWQSGCQLRHAFQGDNGMACPVHAERMGALVRDTAEQPVSAAYELPNPPTPPAPLGPGTATSPPEPASRQGEPAESLSRRLTQFIVATPGTVLSSEALICVREEVILLEAKLAGAKREAEWWKTQQFYEDMATIRGVKP
jgi:hypothetical protein